MSYRVEYAKTGRAGCSVKTCKDMGLKIPKGSLRLGSWLQMEHRGWWAWRHWGCVTPQQCQNLGEFLEDDWQLLDGYDELEDQDQARIRQAVADGHIADDDLLPHIDRSMNRLGAKEAAREAKREAQRAKKLAEKEAEKNAAKALKDSVKEAEKAQKLAQKAAAKAEKLAQKETQTGAAKAEKQKQKDLAKIEEKPDVKVAESSPAAEEHEVTENVATATESGVSKLIKKRKRSAGKDVKLESPNDSDVEALNGGLNNIEKDPGGVTDQGPSPTGPNALAESLDANDQDDDLKPVRARKRAKAAPSTATTVSEKSGVRRSKRTPKA